jgi:hypothetical protein
MTIKQWIHHLLNPHCSHCKEEAVDSQVCESCEILKQQLEIANFEKRQLLQAVLDNAKSNNQPSTVEVNYEQIKPKMATWAMRKQMLEAEDRKQAELMKRSSITEDIVVNDAEIEALEKQLGIQ